MIIRTTGQTLALIKSSICGFQIIKENNLFKVVSDENIIKNDCPAILELNKRINDCRECEITEKGFNLWMSLKGRLSIIKMLKMLSYAQGKYNYNLGYFKINGKIYR